MAIKIGPQPGPQESFLSSPADIVIYGGSAGGGKTFGLLLDPLRYVHMPDFGFVIFRRLSPQIINQGGLWDESMKLYPKVRAKGIRGHTEWKFASGAKGSFRHLQYADTVEHWQGAQIPWMGFDELTHFEESQFFYMLSRNRSVCGMKPCVRCTTNPKAGSWVRKFLAPWLDTDPETKKLSHAWAAESGEIRHFTRLEGKIIWVSADWRDADGDPPKSVTFIRSSIYDNQILMQQDPGYLTNLKSLGEADRRRLLDGDWDVLDGAFFSEFDELKHVVFPEALPAYSDFFAGMDYGKSAPFSFHLCTTKTTGDVRVVDEHYEAGLTPPQQAQAMLRCMERNGVKPTECMVACDPSIFPPDDAEKRIGRYIVEDLWAAGIRAVKANNDRKNGWARVKNFLDGGRLVDKVIKDREGKNVVVQVYKPGIEFFRGKCTDLIRTLPTLRPDKNKPEDLDTKTEDHACDSLRYALMTRPEASEDPDLPTPPKPVDNRPAFMKEKSNAEHW